MKLEKTGRGFEVLNHPSHPHHIPTRLLQQSSVIGDYEDSFDRPGSSALWLDEHFCLNREEVRQLIAHLQAWLDTGSLEVK